MQEGQKLKTDLWEMHVPLNQELNARQDNQNLEWYWTPIFKQLTLAFFSEQLIILYLDADSAVISNTIYKPWSSQRQMHRSVRASRQFHLKYSIVLRLT